MLIVGEWTRSVGDDVYMRLMLGGLLRLVWEIGLSGGDGDGEVGFKVHFDRPEEGTRLLFSSQGGHDTRQTNGGSFTCFEVKIHMKS